MIDNNWWYLLSAILRDEGLFTRLQQEISGANIAWNALETKKLSDIGGAVRGKCQGTFLQLLVSKNFSKPEGLTYPNKGLNADFFLKKNRNKNL